MRSSRLVPLFTLLVGGLGGWAAASGQFDSLLRAESQSFQQPAAQPACETAGTCCDGADRAALAAAVNAHNTKVSANLQPGKKPNIVFIMGDDIGVWNI